MPQFCSKSALILIALSVFSVYPSKYHLLNKYFVFVTIVINSLANEVEKFQNLNFNGFLSEVNVLLYNLRFRFAGQCESKSGFC